LPHTGIFAVNIFDFKIKMVCDPMASFSAVKAYMGGVSPVPPGFKIAVIMKKGHYRQQAAGV